ncbi:hypothetical protein SynA1544_02208 [Synechococcus sp. A15-44]|nr:hypothetical protein SynA1544_02208 [Synechococcus sp. A15-44]
MGRLHAVETDQLRQPGAGECSGGDPAAGFAAAQPMHPCAAGADRSTGGAHTEPRPQ